MDSIPVVCESMQLVHVALLFNVVNGFAPSANGLAPMCARGGSVMASTRMQTLTPGAPTIERPDTLPALPEKWDVPDTFCFPSSMSDDEPPFFKLTLFSSNKDTEYVVGALIRVTGIEETRAREIAQQVKTMGFAVVGEYVQEVAETYGDGLKGKQLVVDVSPAGC